MLCCYFDCPLSSQLQKSETALDRSELNSSADVYYFLSHLGLQRLEHHGWFTIESCLMYSYISCSVHFYISTYSLMCVCMYILINTYMIHVYIVLCIFLNVLVFTVSDQKIGLSINEWSPIAVCMALCREIPTIICHEDRFLEVFWTLDWQTKVSRRYIGDPPKRAPILPMWELRRFYQQKHQHIWISSNLQMNINTCGLPRSRGSPSHHGCFNTKPWLQHALKHHHDVWRPSGAWCCNVHDQHRRCRSVLWFTWRTLRWPGTLMSFMLGGI